MEHSIFCRRLKLIVAFCGLLAFFSVAAPLSAFDEPKPEETLAWCQEMANQAYEMAIEAKVTGDYPIAQRALCLANEATFHVEKVGKISIETANPNLAYSAYNTCNQVKAAILEVSVAARHISGSSADADVVHASSVLLELCEVATLSNCAAMETALRSFRHSR